MTKKVLVVDDDSVTCDLLAAMLRKLGIGSTIAHKGAQAKQMVLDNRFDLILLDLKLPDMDGLQVLEFIRQHSNNQETGVVVTSGFESAQDTARCRNAGCQAFLAKPFTFEQLSNAVNAWLSR